MGTWEYKVLICWVAEWFNES